MSHKLFRTTLFIIILTLGALSFAQAKERHGDLPLSTSWKVFNLDGQARSASGLAAKRLAVLFLEPDDGWHTYAHEPGGFGKPTTLKATLGQAVLPVLYPAGTPEADPLEPSTLVNVYPSGTPLFVPLPDKPAKGARIAASLELLLCAKDKCLPGSLDLAFDLPPGNAPEARTQPWWPKLLAAAKPVPKAEVAITPTKATPETATPAPAEGWSNLKPRYHQPELEVRGLFKAMLLGLLAGFILNFMPCVLPVISIKLSALMAGSAMADAKARRAKFCEHNMCFALGILAYFFILGAILGATGLAWGQIFQKPAIVLGLAALIFALSLSLFGVFSLPIVDLKFDQMTTHPKLQALFTGLLATLLATPCSGPFLGGVLGWTLLQPPWVISSVLVAVGTGMALPYLVMVVFPGLVRLFPKPGPWTGHLEKAVALLLMATCIYLLSILPEWRLVQALIVLWLTAVAAWLWGASGPGFDSARRVLLKLLAVCFLAGAVLLIVRPSAPLSHIDAYSENGLRAMLGQETVVVDFTADWCPSCKVLEQTTLTPGRLGDMKAKYGLKLMKADLTERNPEAEALLAALGSQSIPLLAIFPKNAPDSPLVLRDLFTPSQLEDALKQTARP
jgi:thiol:disulfide interchange protein DsbD